jgi:hypothetical protein
LGAAHGLGIKAEENAISESWSLRPNWNGKGDQQVHTQHQKYLLQHNGPWNPQVIFNQDIGTAIKQWIKLSYYNVVVLNASDDLRNGSIKQWMARWGLCEVLFIA